MSKTKSTYIKTVWLFISQDTPFEQQVDNKIWIVTGHIHHGRIPCCSLTYNYDSKRHRLTIFNRKGQKICDRTATYGSAFEIKDPQKLSARVSLLRYPRGTENIVPWLCGYSNPELRATDKHSYRQISYERKKQLKLNWRDHSQAHSGKNFRFSYIWKDGQAEPLAAYVNPNTTSREIAQILDKYQNPLFPVEFVQSALHNATKA